MEPAPPAAADASAAPRRVDAYLRRDALVNLAFAGLRVFALLYVLRFAGMVLAAGALGLFLLSRRFSGTAAIFIQLGGTHTIQRYLSIHHGDRIVQRSYLLAALAFILVCSVVLLPLAWQFNEPLGRLIFSGSQASTELTFWTWAWTLSTVAALLTMSFMVTERLVVSSNLLRIMTIGGAPLIALMLLGDGSRPQDVVEVAALVTGGCAALGLVAMAIRYRLTPLPSAASLRAAVGTLIRYGFPRAASALLEVLTAFLPPWLLRADPEAAGYFIVALTLLRALELIILPVTEILALATARAIGRKDERHISGMGRLLFGLALYLGGFAFVFLFPWLDRLLVLWLGQDDLAAHVYFYAAWTVFGIVPVIVFYSQRNMIEVTWTFPYNLVTQLISVALLLGVTFALQAATEMSLMKAVMIGDLAMLWAMGLLTTLWMRRFLGGIRFFGLWRLGAMCAVIFAAQSLAAWSGGVTEAALALALSAAVVGVGLCYRPPPLVAALAAAMLPRRRASAAAEET